jgi:rubrerythrin
MASLSGHYEWMKQALARAKAASELSERDVKAPIFVEQERKSVATWEKKIATFEKEHPRIASGRHSGMYGNQTRNVTCAVCGKLTHSTIAGYSGLELCRKHLAEALYENQHSDDGHTGAMKDCPVCGPQYRTMARLRNAKESN